MTIPLAPPAAAPDDTSGIRWHSGRNPGVTAAAMYTRCPYCRRVLPAARFFATRNGVGSWPREVTCGGCHRWHLVGPAALLEADTCVPCAACGQTVACPAAAERVRCTACAAERPGPAARR